MICPACAAAAVDGDRFCRRCGHPLPAVLPPAPAAAPGGLPPAEPAPPDATRPNIVASDSTAPKPAPPNVAPHAAGRSDASPDEAAPPAASPHEATPPNVAPHAAGRSDASPDEAAPPAASPHEAAPPNVAPHAAGRSDASPDAPVPPYPTSFAEVASEGAAADRTTAGGRPAPPQGAPSSAWLPMPPPASASGAWPFTPPFEPPAPPPRRRPPRSGSTLALIFIGLILLLAATNPSPAAYVAWAAQRFVPGAAFPPVRDAAYLAVERATVAESYGLCTVFQTSFTTGTMTVVGIVGQFVTVGNAPPPAPLPRRRQAPRRHSAGGIQI